MTEKNGFNHQPPNIMHIDLNSCFASIEQQANPRLRGVPVVVSAYPTDGGCILAPSREAKEIGIKTGMRVGEGRKICSDLKILTPDPPKYRYVHQQMMGIFGSYTPRVEPKSIDEAVLVFDETPGVDGLDSGSLLSTAKDGSRLRESTDETPGVLDSLADKDPGSFLFDISRSIKNRIKSEIGEWLTVSVGISTNRFLAKTAASLRKPDGLEEINYLNINQQIANLKLEDLCGINQALKLRLNLAGIFTPLEFLNADRLTLKTAFRSVMAYHWYMRLRGWEVDDWKPIRKSIGHSYALPRQTNEINELSQILYRLCEKVGRRLRDNGYEASGVNLNLVYKDWTHSQHRQKLAQPIFASSDIYREALKILNAALSEGSTFNVKPDLPALAGGKVEPPKKPLRNLSVSVFALSQSLYQQPTLFETPACLRRQGVDGLDSGSLTPTKKKSLTQALDKINNKYGEFTITLAPLIDFKKKILDRISFGGIRDMENLVLQ